MKGCPSSMLRTLPQSGNSSGTQLGVPSEALLHIAVSLPSRCRVVAVFLP